MLLGRTTLTDGGFYDSYIRVSSLATAMQK